jgi:uncharacterized OB-fold protein
MVGYLHLDGGHPVLVAQECTTCGALYFDRRNACASCGARSFTPKPLQSEGFLRTYTIVYRAAPNVPAPYISAIIDLDGGGVIKANLRDVEPNPDLIRLGGRVRLTTFVAGVDDDATEAIGFGFAQLEGGAAA